MNLQLTTSTNNKSSFDPTPRLKSSPVPILFISFNHEENQCKYCKNDFGRIRQKYCGNCLFEYINDTTDYKKYLDARFEFTTEESYWGIYIYIIYGTYEERYQLNRDSYFKQTICMDDYYYHYKRDDCKLCGKSDGHSFCSDCYLISSGWIESILTKKKHIPILYLPWWDNCSMCIVCKSQLKFESDCQKWCPNCFIIYTGCRYCLTTNIIFGFTRQSQCKKCERISFISFINTTYINYYKNIENIEEFLISSHNQIAVYVNNIDKNSDSLRVYNFIRKLNINLSSLKSLVSLYPQIINAESSIPITFTPFNNNENKCHFCGNKYLETSLYKQKYCKLCLFLYIKYTTNNIDVYIYNTSNTFCMKHKSRNSDSYTQNIQEWCVECSEMLYFKQSITAYSLDKSYYKEQNGIIKSEKDCKLCGKSIPQQISSNDTEFRLCSNCYLVSSGWTESTLTKRLVPILYLPWWDTYSKCVVCSIPLESISDCQKWCSYCFIIYIGCRYCLTTNIIFGLTNQSQCKKCKKVLFVTIITATDTASIEFVISKRINIKNCHQIANYMNNIDTNSNPLKVYQFIKNNLKSTKTIMKIEYSQLKTPEQIGIGGFGTIYRASWKKDIDKYTPVAIKRFSNSQNFSKDFLNEISSFHQYYNRFEHVIKCFGITQDLTTNEPMIVMEYAEGGDLHNHYLQDFANITWKNKLAIMLNISRGLDSIHNENFIHRDLHSGNILFFPNKSYSKWQIGDLGLSQPADNTLNNNEIYGVIPYISPEIFDGIKFSKASDVYSMGMIMWELTTGCKPFNNIEHDTNLIYKIIDGERPEITCDTPKCFADLIKRCWDSDPSKRPIIKEIRRTIAYWSYKMKDVDQFVQAEKVRSELIKSKKLGPEFAAKSHPGAIYTSRALNSLIPKSSPSTASLNVKEGNELEISFEEPNNNEEYISKEQDIDISEDLHHRKKKIKISHDPNI